MTEGPNYKPEQEFELTPEAREVVRTFQEASNLIDQGERKRMFKEFIEKLLRLTSPPEWGIPEQEIPGIIIGTNRRDNYAIVGSGTSGQKIYFSGVSGRVNEMSVSMYESDRSINQKFWDRFLANFGKDRVDLLQEVE